MKTHWTDKLDHPCQDGLVFALAHDTFESAWNACTRGDWMIWWLRSARKGTKDQWVELARRCAIRVKYTVADADAYAADAYAAAADAYAAAAVAAVAADAAADAADAAADAADAAAAVAAYAAAYAAYAAAAAVAAYAAAYAAERLKQAIDIRDIFYTVINP